MAWNKLIRRQFLVDNEISFHEGLIHEDELWSFQVACMVQTMCCVKSITYIYCDRCNSIMNMLDRNRLNSLIHISEKIEAFARERDLENNMNVCQFLIRWREGLGHKAWLYGKRLAYQTYREHVWKHPALIQISRRHPELKEPMHWHHALPAHIGFCYYMMCQYVKRKFSA